VTAGPDARLFDLGYRGYDGPRERPERAILTLAEFTARRVLGLGRGALHKVLPAIVLAIAYVPALFSVAYSTLANDVLAEDLITYGDYMFIIGSALALFAALAYAGLFVAAGLWFKRAVWWGLAFVLIWENVAAYTAEGAARFTVIGWASSVLGLAPDVDVQLEAGSAAVAFVVLPATAFAGWLAATWRYRRADID
jgi:hypothetical protein